MSTITTNATLLMRAKEARVTLAEMAAAFRVDGGQLICLGRYGTRPAGSRVGRMDVDGYIKVRFGGRRWSAHRVVWLLTHGEWPSSHLDHRDGCRTNNHPSNLRLCNGSTNQQNAKARGKLGLKGVVSLPRGRFQAEIGKTYLGSFGTPEEAGRAYDAVVACLYGEFVRLNFSSGASRSQICFAGDDARPGLRNSSRSISPFV